MKTFIVALMLTGIATIYLLSAPKNELGPEEFSEALKSDRNILLIDLRSVTDFSKGHIPGAINIDSASSAYNWQVSGLETAQKVFIYGQNEERNKQAAAYFESQGFHSVTLLKGGFDAWLNAGYVVTPAELISAAELTLNEFCDILEQEHLVIVCFYLPGNQSCKKIGTALDELAIDYYGKIKIFRIDLETHKHLADQMGIQFSPTLQFYENGTLCETLKGVDEKNIIDHAFHLREYVSTDL